MANHVLLETIEITQTASSVVFDNIPQTGYTDLKLVISARSTRGTYAEDGLGIKLNSSTSGYTYKILGGNGGGLYNLDTSYEQTWVCNIPASNATSGVFGVAEAYIPNYTSSFAKSYSVEGNAENNSSTGYMTIGAVLQSSTSPITAITLLAQNGNLLAGSTFSLYGITAVETSPTIAPKATGGNLVSTDGTYWYHTFLTSGYFVPQTSLTNVDYLVVAGGGGGGAFKGADYAAGAGGGAGGLRCTVGATGGGGSLETPLSLTAQPYTVIVGAGGASGPTNTRVAGNNGNNSVFATITSIGGGGGGAGAAPNAAKSGGSGGGGADGQIGAAGTVNQGYSGNTSGGGGGNSPGYAGGGGGGAGSAGAAAPNTSTGGNGGNGVTTSISGSSVTYAGGGGSGVLSGTVGTGGTGGGGNGASGGGAGGNGVASTGGGGGGNGGLASGSAAGASAGGSGIVIIRYAIA